MARKKQKIKKTNPTKSNAINLAWWKLSTEKANHGQTNDQSSFDPIPEKKNKKKKNPSYYIAQINLSSW